MKNTLNQKKQQNFLMLLSRPSLIGTEKEKLSVSEQKEDIEDSYYLTSIKNLESQIQNYNQEEKYAIVESLLPLKKKTWKHKLNSSKETILTTKLLEILDLESTLKEKDLIPFWTQQSKEISKKLWLPTETDCVDSVLNSYKELLNNNQMGKSWFSIKKKHPQKKNLLTTSFQLSQFSLQDSMDLEVIQSKKKLKKQQQLKTLKIRLFPTNKEKDELQLMLEQYRWYYNATVNIMNEKYTEKQLLNKKSWSNIQIRDLIRKYYYREVNWIEDEKIINIQKQFIYDENKNEIPIPYWWTKIHSRIPRGASDKYTSSLNSAISNLKNGNISSFKMKYMTKKDSTYYMHFEDESFPSIIKKIKSRYWYTTKNRKRKTISFEDIFKERKRGVEIIYEKHTNRYYLHYPIEYDWFPSEDKRIENQNKFINKNERIISLDPGIRKFLVGYNPQGESVFIAEKENEYITRQLLQVDKIEDGKKKYIKWKYIKNLIEELHWKTIIFLIENYDIIILPEFKTSKMIKSKKLGKITKRLMNMYSFYKFKEKLKYKCRIYNKKLIIVDESYTSCTCGVCGNINKNLKTKEVFSCSECNIKIDRDVSGARNILIKNIKYNPTLREI